MNYSKEAMDQGLEQTQSQTQEPEQAEVGEEEIEQLLEQNAQLKEAVAKNAAIFEKVAQGELTPQVASIKSTLLIFEILGIEPLVEGMKNHLGFNKDFEREVRRVKRTKRPLSLIILDGDKFKEINDTVGHLEGSQTIIRTGKKLVEMTRDIDFKGHVGGDEFAIVLPDTNVVQALHIGIRLLQELPKVAPQGTILTFSLGIAEFDHLNRNENAASLFHRADINGLYKVKEVGGNSIGVALTPNQDLAKEQLPEEIQSNIILVRI